MENEKKKFFFKRKKKEKLSQNTLKPSPQLSKKSFKKYMVFLLLEKVIAL